MHGPPVGGAHASAHGHRHLPYFHGRGQGQPDAGVIRDPVCGMEVPDGTSPARATPRWPLLLHHVPRQGFLGPDSLCCPPAYATVVAGTRYTCPMHPEITRDAPSAY